MKHPGWLLMIAGAFSLQPELQLSIAAALYCGFVIGCFVGTRTRRPERRVLRRARQQVEPPSPIRFVRAMDLMDFQDDLFAFQRRSANRTISRTYDAPPLAPGNPGSERVMKSSRNSSGGCRLGVQPARNEQNS
jgi:hypothetical protein